MKKILITMAMLLTVGVIAAPAAPNHRHRHTVQKVDADTTSQAIEAYSDTTSWADDGAYTDDDADDGAQRRGNSVVQTTSDDLEELFKMMFGFGGLGILACMMLFLGILLVIVVPLVIVFLIVRYFMRKHGKMVDNARHNCPPGHQPAGNNAWTGDYTASRMWQRGVQNLAVGVGLMLFFFFLGATPLVGIGALVACMGAGKMYIGRYSRQANCGTDERKGPANGGNSSGSGDYGRDGNGQYADPDEPSCDVYVPGENKTGDNGIAGDGTK